MPIFQIVGVGTITEPQNVRRVNELFPGSHLVEHQGVSIPLEVVSDTHVIVDLTKAQGPLERVTMYYLPAAMDHGSPNLDQVRREGTIALAVAPRIGSPIDILPAKSGERAWSCMVELHPNKESAQKRIYHHHSPES